MKGKVKVIHRENRLGKLLSQPGGITVGSALQKARENLETIRETGLKKIGRAHV